MQKFENNQLVYNLRATSFNWDSVARKWLLRDVQERFINGISETVKMHATLLKNFDFKPLDLRKDDYLKDQMTTPDLDAFISKERARGSEALSTLLVERYNRDAIPISVLILTMIGATVASRKVRGGSGMHLAIGVIISMIYVLFSRFTVVFATKGNLTPWLAAWTPNIICALLALWLYKRAPK